MANYRAVATGNWSSGATWDGGAVPPNGEGHNIYSNGFTVTIDTNINVAILTNAAITASFVGGGTSAAVGGVFNLNNGVTITAAITKGNTSSPSVQLTGSNSATIVGNVSGSAAGPGSSHNTVTNSSTGTLTITGNITGGSATSSGPQAVSNGTGNLNVTGNVIGGSGGNGSSVFAFGIVNGSGVVNVTGNVSGGSGLSGNSGISGSGAINIVGSVSSGSTTNSLGVSSTGSQLTIVGDVTATNGIAAVSSTATTNQFSGSFIFSQNGTNPIICNRFLVSPTPANARTRYALNGSGTYVDMFTADNNLGQANPTDVRNGVSYASGILTGRLTVPARGSVSNSVAYGPSMPFTATRSGTTATATLAYSYPYTAGDVIVVTGASNAEWNGTYTIESVISGTSITFNVPVTYSSTAGTGAQMQTVGTAMLTAAAIFNTLTSTMTTPGSIGERLANVSTVAVTGQQITSALG